MTPLKPLWCSAGTWELLGSHQSGTLRGGLGLCHVHNSHETDLAGFGEKTPVSRQLLQLEAPFQQSVENIIIYCHGSVMSQQ